MSGFGEERCLPIENTALITRRIRRGTRVASSPSMTNVRRVYELGCLLVDGNMYPRLHGIPI